jgi:hypothetical protein
MLRGVECYFCTDVSKQTIGPFLNGQEVLVTLADGTDMLYWNVCTELQLNAAQYPRTAQSASIYQRNPQITQKNKGNKMGSYVA